MAYFWPALLVLAGGVADWQRVSEDDGFVLETKAVAGSAFEEVRVSAHSEVSPEAFIAAAWGKAEDQSGAREVIRRDLLDESPLERTYYELVAAPLVSNRDFVLNNRRIDDRGAHVYEIRFRTVNDPRRPPVAGIVRMPDIHGSCTVTPGDHGGTEIVYQMYTDLGGSLPAWIARAKQRESAVNWVKDRIKKARQ
jgi:hypothetical protein